MYGINLNFARRCKFWKVQLHNKSLISGDADIDNTRVHIVPPHGYESVMDQIFYACTCKSV